MNFETNNMLPLANEHRALPPAVNRLVEIKTDIKNRYYTPGQILLEAARVVLIDKAKNV